MGRFTLPKNGRAGLRTREVQPGLDFPSWFLDGIKGLDEKLYLVWHPYRVLWDNMMNQYHGELENPRFIIGRDYRFGEQEIWGYVLTNNKGNPIPENKWHLWRHCPPHGWAHVAPIDEHTPVYLRFCLDKLNTYCEIQNKHGDLGLAQFIRFEQEELQKSKRRETETQMMDKISYNKNIFRRAYENYMNGIVDRPDPEKEVITSYASQKNKAKIVRKVTDEEGGWLD